MKWKKGRTRNDDMKFLNGVFWILGTKASWRDLTSDYGKQYAVHKRFLRSEKNGKWEKLAKVLNQNADLKYIFWQ